MKIYNVTQGSPEWHALRARHHCASEAPVMMGASKKTSRTELVRMKATGDEKVFSQWVQENLLDRGHEVEARARAVIETTIGEDLYPATIGDDQERFLASFDGITMSDEVGFECKLHNEELAAAVRAGATEFPNGHEWQLEQQLLVNPNLQRIVFACSDGTPEKTVSTIYIRVPGRAKALVRGWEQFDEDVKNYVHVEVVPKATATLKAGLPTVLIDVKGEVTLASNLDKLDAALRLYVDAIPAKPTTDEDFANCEQAVKDLKTAEERLEASREAALAHFESVAAMNRLVDSMIDLARTTRLRTDHLVDDRKKSIRAEILTKAKTDFAAHVEKLNVRLGRPFMPVVPCDFVAAMKGKKTIAGLQDGVNVTMAAAKIAANDVADRIQVNLACLTDTAAGYENLFADLQQLCLKPCDDFRLVVRARVDDHKRAEEKRLADEREKIRLEEEAKARVKVEVEERAKAQAALAMTKHAETMYPPPEPLKPAPSTGPALIRYESRTAPGATITVGVVPSRPTDNQIIDVLVNFFEVPEAVVIGWLIDMDLQAAVRGRSLTA